MLRPLHRSAQDVRRSADGHAGLWFDKFCNTWPADQSWCLRSEEKQNPKHDWLKTLVGSVGDPKQLDEARLRLARVVQAAGGGVEVFRTESRFVTGLGRAHPVENGFTFHSTLGVPFLPGSSVKGLVRAWARDEGISKDELTRLFGAAGDEGREGSFIFFDALPVAPVDLEVDVLTPHSAAWTPKDPPGDWRSPKPVPFLVTARGARFLFGLAPRPGAEGDLDRIRDYLTKALKLEGAGAKTAVGYGRFAKERGRFHVEVEKANEDQLAELILRYLEKGELTVPEERAGFAAAVRELRPDWLASWRKKQRVEKTTKPGGDKLKARAKLINGEPGV